MTDWQPIETAPRVGKKRLLFMLARGKQVTGWRVYGNRVLPEFTSGATYLATHWMPLPSPPEPDQCSSHGKIS